MTFTEKVAVTKQYIESLRNEPKRRYAIAYGDYVALGLPEEPLYTGLTYMGAQAVRMRLSAIWR